MGNLFCCTTSSHPQPEARPRARQARRKPATPPSHSPTNTARANPKPRARPKAKAKPNPYAPRGGAAAASPSTVRVLDGVIPHHPRLRVTDKYHLGRELGRGEFGVTRLATDRGAARERLACKSIPKARLRTAVDVADVRREVAIMASLPDHPALVRMRAAYEDDEAVHIVMELCDGGELFDRIVARGRYTERAAAAAARTVAEVVRACHAHGVMHRDLKPENFLYAGKSEDAQLKAIDFGLSVFFRPGLSLCLFACRILLP